MAVVICHPENYKKLKGSLGVSLPSMLLCSAIEVKPSDFVPETEPTGKWILPNGAAVFPEHIRIDMPFVSYGPEDFDYLRYVGAIKQEYSPCYYFLAETNPRARFFEQTPTFYMKSDLNCLDFSAVPILARLGYVTI